VKILFFTHYFPPEVNAPANRTHEHCREWIAAGHEVHVVTCTPSHPLGRPFEGYGTPWYRYDKVDGIHVHRVWTYLAQNRGVLKRTLNFVSFIPTAVLRARRLGRFDVAIGTSPQFFCAVAIWVYARLSGTPWVFEVRDLWPESIPAVGAMRKSAVLRLVERLELRMYRDASAIVCLTRAFMENLASRGVDHHKLAFVPNGIVPSFWQAGNRSDGRAALGASDGDVVVSYVGTVGMAHGLRTTLEAARILQQRTAAVKLVIVGDGAELPELRRLAAGQGLWNVSFTGLLPRHQMPSILAATDIALVTLKPKDVFKTVLPSKMFEAMAAGRPIVLAVDGEARSILETACAGMFVPPGDAEELAAAIDRLTNDDNARMLMGAAGARFVKREFSRAAWAGRYTEVLTRIAAGPMTAPTRSPLSTAPEKGTQL
jgi:glycosyltransferase involved in cell wall biosynthesis